MTQVGAALRQGAARLAAAGSDTPALDARLLLGYATGRDQAALLRDPAAEIDPARFDALLDRRAAHEPVALILGRQGFWSLEFEVSAATLIPRPDSETLLQAATSARPPHAVRRVLDLGTGTGCLLLAALTEFPGAWGLGIDRAPEAAALAHRNAARLGLAARAAFACADWAAPVRGTFDLVLSNPPYIPSHEIAGLMPEIARFEPRTALDGGADGLDAYRALLAVLPRLVAPGGLAILEAGMDQAPGIAALAATAGFTARTRPDLAGIDRAVLLERAPAEKGVGSGPPGD